MLNLRRHTYKRPQDQTTAEVCAHIESVQARERRLPWIDRRIAVLEVLSPFCSSEDAHLSEALAAACGSGNIGPAAWLIEHGADIHFTSWNAFRHAKVDCLTNEETYGERTEISACTASPALVREPDGTGRLARALLASRTLSQWTRRSEPISLSVVSG